MFIGALGESMKKLFVVFVALILVFSLSSIAVIAKAQHKGLVLNRIVILEDNPVITRVTVEKIDTKADFSDGKVIVSIPELGIRSSRRFDIEDKRESKSVLLHIPTDVSGEYYIRIVVISDDVRRIKHRLITI